MKTAAAVGDLLENAGRLVDRRSMVWFRRLAVPLGDVWNAVSTRDGLRGWWMRPEKIEIDLRPGGVFRHHWDSTVLEVQDRAVIAYAEMRFELQPDGDATLFAFVARWSPDYAPPPSDVPEGALPTRQPGGPGTPTSDVCAGWHGAIDALQKALTGKSSRHTWEEGCQFYEAYLADLVAWASEPASGSRG